MIRAKERHIQNLIVSHPYLLDPFLINERGTKERRVGNGRIDVDFETDHGLVVVECKVSSVSDKDTIQLRRYLGALMDRGQRIAAAYLVAPRPVKALSWELLAHEPVINLLYLLEHFPLELSLCEGRHYFDASEPECNICQSRAIPGHEIILSI
jgi:hypothetical protein